MELGFSVFMSTCSQLTFWSGGLICNTLIYVVGSVPTHNVYDSAMSDIYYHSNRLAAINPASFLRLNGSYHETKEQRGIIHSCAIHPTSYQNIENSVGMNRSYCNRFLFTCMHTWTLRTDTI